MATPITANDELNTLSDRELLYRVIKQNDHIDTQLHILMQLLEQHRPLLDRLGRLADPGKGMRAWMTMRGKPDGG